MAEMRPWDFLVPSAAGLVLRGVNPLGVFPGPPSMETLTRMTILPCWEAGSQSQAAPMTLMVCFIAACTPSHWHVRLSSSMLAHSQAIGNKHCDTHKVTDGQCWQLIAALVSADMHGGACASLPGQLPTVQILLGRCCKLDTCEVSCSWKLDPSEQRLLPQVACSSVSAELFAWVAHLPDYPELQ